MADTRKKNRANWLAAGRRAREKAKENGDDADKAAAAAAAAQREWLNKRGLKKADVELPKGKGKAKAKGKAKPKSDKDKKARACAKKMLRNRMIKDGEEPPNRITDNWLAEEDNAEARKEYLRLRRKCLTKGVAPKDDKGNELDPALRKAALAWSSRFPKLRELEKRNARRKADGREPAKSFMGVNLEDLAEARKGAKQNFASDVERLIKMHKQAKSFKQARRDRREDEDRPKKVSGFFTFLAAYRAENEGEPKDIAKNAGAAWRNAGKDLRAALETLDDADVDEVIKDHEARAEAYAEYSAEKKAEATREKAARAAKRATNKAKRASKPKGKSMRREMERGNRRRGRRQSQRDEQRGGGELSLDEAKRLMREYYAKQDARENQRESERRGSRESERRGRRESGREEQRGAGYTLW